MTSNFTSTTHHPGHFAQGYFNDTGGNNITNHSGHPVTEGGFLSGRNPFMFITEAPLPTFTIQLLVIVSMSRIVKLVLSPIKQPSVIAEIVSGILLGPTGLGRLPHFTEWVFPKPSLPFLHLMSNFGLVLFLYLVGLELDPRVLKKSFKGSLIISVAGMILPFTLGCGASFILYEYIEPEEHRKSFFSYLLFLGVAIAITAFPVLARILSELNLLKTKVGGITMSAAAVDDTTSWCLLALVISIIHANNSNLIAIYVFLMGLAYSLFLILIFRPIFIWCLRKAGVFEQETPSQVAIFFALMITFTSAFITDAIGIHAIFGGFLAGIIMPHENGFAYHITEKLEDMVQILFLPLYFALSGLRTKIGALDDILSWSVVALVVVCSCFGKIFGCTIAARITKLNWRESLTVGFLMNCKGLVELIVLNLGYDAGVISDKTFAIMVIMALVTTFITVPAVSFLYPPKYHDKPSGPGNFQVKPPKGGCGSLLVSVNRIEQVTPILSVVHFLQSKLNRELRERKQKKKWPSLTSLTGNISPGHAHLQKENSQIELSPSGGGVAGGVFNFKDTKDVHLHSSKIHGHRKRDPGVIINILRLVELTERDSSVMLQTSQEALKDDPITNLLRTFCSMSNSANTVQGMIKVATMPKFGETLAKSAEEMFARYCLIPWSGSGSMTEDLSRRGSRLSLALGVATSQRRPSLHTPVQHSHFIQDLLSKAKLTTVLILVDRGLQNGDQDENEEEIHQSEGKLVSYKQIYLPFFGGRDDRESLSIVMGLSHISNLKIKVVYFKTVQEGERKLSTDSESSYTDERQDTVANQIGQVQVQVDGSGAVVKSTEDDQAISKHFGSERVEYQKLETVNPIHTAVQQIQQLGPQDLVVIGRSNLVANSHPAAALAGLNLFKADDPERRKVLGDVAEAILSCQSKASLLVVQAARQADFHGNGNENEIAKDSFA